jgi:hypothetical protein
VRNDKKTLELLQKDFNFTGTAKVKTRIEAPWKSYYYIEKFDRNQWNRAMIDRRIPDFCKGLDNPNEPWYTFTSHLKQRNCPYEAGWNQTFNREKYGEIPPLVTRSFIGKYRVTFYSYLKDEKGVEQTDCLRNQFEIADV